MPIRQKTINNLLKRGRLNPIIQEIENADKVKERWIVGWQRKLTSRKKGQKFMLQKYIKLDENGQPVIDGNFELEQKEEAKNDVVLKEIENNPTGYGNLSNSSV